MQIEDLRLGASVVSSDDHKLGTLSHFVVRKSDFKLTHIVVDTGILRSGEPLWKGGWGLSHDRVVPMGVLSSADSDSVRLTMTADEFRDLSVDYIEERFAQIPDDEPGRVDLSDLRRIATSLPGEPGPYFMYDTTALAAWEADIKKDSPVWRMNPHQKIGEVERLLVEEKTEKSVAIVIRRGHVFSKDVVLPMSYVSEFVADIVRVDIGDDELESLDEYQSND
jgi:PRC-barrel domain